jgi:ribosomal protein S18 acetylase RimI-like enzyme
VTGRQIREAAASDLDTLVAFNLAMAFETEKLKLDPETLRRGIAAVLRDRHKGFYLVAEQDRQVVGQLMVTFEWSDWRNGDWWWFQSVYVAPGHRRSGVFRALYDTVLAQSQAAGARGLRLYVEKDNRGAQATYTALGMREGHYRLFELGQE